MENNKINLKDPLNLPLEEMVHKNIISVLIMAINRREKIIFQSLDEKRFTSKEIANIKRIDDYLICQTNYLGLFGIRGLIYNIDNQQRLKEFYGERDQSLLSFLSNIVTNRLIHRNLQWLCNHNFFYMAQIKKEYYPVEFGYWDCFHRKEGVSTKVCQTLLVWKITKMCIRVGQSMASGIIGHKKLILLEKKIVPYSDQSLIYQIAPTCLSLPKIGLAKVGQQL